MYGQRSHLRHYVQLICLLFVSWKSGHYWLRYSKLYIWPWKFKVMIIATVKPNGHIQGLDFNQYVCFSFCGNRTIFGWDIVNSIQGQGHDENRPKSNQVIYRSGSIIVPKIKEIPKVVLKLSSEEESAVGGGGVRTVQKESHPGISGWLNYPIIIIITLIRIFFFITLNSFFQKSVRFYNHSLKCIIEMTVKQIIACAYVCSWDMCEWEKGMSIVLIFY